MNNLVDAVVSCPVTSKIRCSVLGAIAAVLILAACGDSSSIDTDSGSSVGVGADSTIEDAADANLSALEDADDARDQQILDVNDGSITTLRDAVVGDRPVLIWFWAPH